MSDSKPRWPRALPDSPIDLAEDSFILLDALEIDAAYLRDKKPNLALEIG